MRFVVCRTSTRSEYLYGKISCSAWRSASSMPCHSVGEGNFQAGPERSPMGATGAGAVAAEGSGFMIFMATLLQFLRRWVWWPQLRASARRHVSRLTGGFLLRRSPSDSAQCICPLADGGVTGSSPVQPPSPAAANLLVGRNGAISSAGYVDEVGTDGRVRVRWVTTPASPVPVNSQLNFQI